nr:hypothetical protein [Mesorhizobium sp. SARCC-RB16n]
MPKHFAAAEFGGANVMCEHKVEASAAYCRKALARWDILNGQPYVRVQLAETLDEAFEEFSSCHAAQPNPECLGILVIAHTLGESIEQAVVVSPHDFDPGAACLRQANAARIALEQLDVELLFEFDDVAADRGFLDPQRSCGLTHAAVIHGRKSVGQQLDSVPVPRHVPRAS